MGYVYICRILSDIFSDLNVIFVYARDWQHVHQIAFEKSLARHDENTKNKTDINQLRHRWIEICFFVFQIFIFSTGYFHFDFYVSFSQNIWSDFFFSLHTNIYVIHVMDAKCQFWKSTCPYVICYAVDFHDCPIHLPDIR